MKIGKLGIVIIVTIILLVVLNWKTIAKELGLESLLNPDAEKVNGATLDPGTKLDCSLALKKGSSGPEVQQLQTMILTVDKTLLPKGGNDGVFGQETLSALQKLTGYSSITLNQAVGLLNIKLKQLGSNYQLQSLC